MERVRGGREEARMLHRHAASVEEGRVDNDVPLFAVDPRYYVIRDVIGLFAIYVPAIVK